VEAGEPTEAGMERAQDLGRQGEDGCLCLETAPVPRRYQPVAHAPAGVLPLWSCRITLRTVLELSPRS